MLIALIQTILAAIACGLLYIAFRGFRNDRTIALLVAAGVLLRAAGGQILFWISYLELPFGRALQSGSGFWFYARDGRKYFNQAVTAAEHGIGAIATLDPKVISPGFTQLLALFGWMFGPVASTALLLNIAAYLGTCAILVALAGQQKRLAMIAVAAVSFSPSVILWSTQPLKDVFFLFLFAAFVGVAAWWISAWQREERPFARATLVTLLMLVVLCAIAAIRWYFALALLISSAPVLVIASLRTRMPLRATALLVAMYGVVLAGGIYIAGPHLPTQMQMLIASPDVAGSPRILADMLEGTRVSFDKLAGSTKINVGETLSGAEPPRAARFLSGSAALLLPRPLARAAGLIEVSGGRGLWLFADFDTIFFDIFLIMAIVTLVRSPHLAKWQNPLLWLVLGVTLLIAAAFVYCVGNFGALFRYRSMIFLGVVLIPVATAWSAASRTTAAALRPHS